MSKKRNLAVLMAAATVATSVAPVFAAEAADLDEASLRAKVEELLNVKYSKPAEDGNDSSNETGDFKNSVYEITIKGTSTRIKDIADLNKSIEEAKVKGNDLVLSVTDKGHIKTDDGQIVYEVKTKNDFVAAVDADLVTEITASPAVRSAKLVDINGKTTGTPVAVEVELQSGKKFNVEVGDYKFEYSKPIDANGNAITGLTVDSDDSVKKNVAGFELYETTEGTRGPGRSLFAEYTMGSKVTIDKNLSDYYSKDGGYTETGVNLVKQLSPAVTGESTIVVDGIRYKIAGITEADSVIKATADGYQLTMEFKYVKDSSTAVIPSNKNVKLVLKASTQEELSRVRTDILNANKVVEGRITTLAGEDRFSTAVEVSKEAYEKYDSTTGDTADAVVLVGENAIVDGLASAPLAKQKGAPILLTKADEVPAQTMKEIKRIVDKGSDIYLVGGKTTISEAVENQLKKELNASIIRVSGEDRYATSSAIAEKMTVTSDKAFVVGGDGLADAMSISSYAAQTGSPILVTPADKLGKDAKSSLKDLDTVTDVKVIGGATKVSTQVLKDIKDDAGIVNPTRIAGENRADTNAEVLKTYYATAITKPNSAFVAKDGYVGGDGQLIDALAVAPFAASKSAPLVLTSEELTKDQKDQVEASVTADKNSKLYQAGQGVGAEALKSLLKIFGL